MKTSPWTLLLMHDWPLSLSSTLLFSSVRRFSPMAARSRFCPTAFCPFANFNLPEGKNEMKHSGGENVRSGWKFAAKSRARCARLFPTHSENGVWNFDVLRVGVFDGRCRVCFIICWGIRFFRRYRSFVSMWLYWDGSLLNARME